MVKIFSHSLNIHRLTHPLADWITDTLVSVCPDEFERVYSIPQCDCVITNAPAAPPYSFDIDTAMQVWNANKPFFVFNDADGAPPDCEHEKPTKEINFCNFVRRGSGIRAYFYREWFKDYVCETLAPSITMLPFELVGIKNWNHPKDTKDYSEGIDRDQFMRRPLEVLFAQTAHVQSRSLMYNALQGRSKTYAINLAQQRMLGHVYMEKLRDARITICLEGAGVKCQCHCEAPIASVMAMHDIAMHETYPWIDGFNCIRLPYLRGTPDDIKGEGSLVHNYGRGLLDVGAALSKLDDAVKDLDRLWVILCNGMETARKYSLPNYYRNHIGANIKKFL